MDISAIPGTTRASSDAVVDIRGLVKTYGATRALDGLDLRVERGTVHGFLGPNGAGKTTTLRVMLGSVRADGGSVSVLGMDPWRDIGELHARLAYVPGDVALWPNLTGGEVIDLMGRLQGGHDPARRAELLEHVRPRPDQEVAVVLEGQPAEGGARRGAGYRRGALPARRADERTRPVDGAGVPHLRPRSCATRGCTVLLSSHILSEAEALSDTVTIIRAGRAVETGTLADLRHLQRLSISAETEHELHGVGDIPGLHDVVFDDRHLRCTVDPTHLGELLSHLSAAGIVSLESQPPTLEQLFLSQYGPGERDG